MTAKSFPTAEMQKLLFNAQKYEKQQAPYNMAFAFDFIEGVDVEKMTQAYQLLLNRHESLRSFFFKDSNGDLRQGIVEVQQIPSYEIDLPGLTSDQINLQIDLAINQTFDLKKAPLFRIYFFKLRNHRIVHLLVVHHIITDGWSFWMLLEEVKSTYCRLKKDSKTGFNSLNQFYQDFVVGQRQYLASEKSKKDMLFWKSRLGDQSTQADLPVDFSRGNFRKFNGATVSKQENSKLRKLVSQFLKSEEMIEQRRDRSIGEFWVLFAAYFLLLHKYIGQSNLIVKSPVLGRKIPEQSKIVGCFINVLPFSFSFQKNEKVCDFLGRFYDCGQEVLKHNEYPFPLILKGFDTELKSNRVKIPQTGFAYRVFYHCSELELLLEGKPIEFGDSPAKEFRIDQQNSQEDLQLEIVRLRSQWRFIWNYRPNLFLKSTIDRMSKHYLQILEAICKSPNVQIKDLQFLNSTEQEEILYKWNDNNAEQPKDYSIVQAFESAVARNPEKVALIQKSTSIGWQLSYQELNLIVNQLAHHLSNNGVKKNSFVGVCFDRSIENIAAILAVLKCGAAYVPLDPSYPKERLNMMIADCGMSVMFSREKFANKLPDKKASLLFWEDFAANREYLSSSNLFCEIDEQDVALLVYSSGSTGTPNGSQLTHKNILRLKLHDFPKTVSPEDVHSHGANPSFDGAVVEIFKSLLNGRSLVILDDKTILSPHLLKSVIREKRITYMFLTTALFNKHGIEQPATFQDLRFLVTGGEPMNLIAARSVRKKCPELQLVNEYGPSECGPNASYYVVDDSIFSRESVPIGKPLKNSKIYILDNDLKPVPIGVEGEIYIGGMGVGKGYINRKKLTQQKFIKNPFSKLPNAQLYKTGDKAKYLQDGNILFLGRDDDQLKVRGFRIEIPEIEMTLSKHPAILANAVTAKKDNITGTLLVGFVTLRTEWKEKIRTREIRSFLLERLPEYMVPSVIRIIDQLPLSPNQKIDRKKLAQLAFRDEGVDENGQILNETEQSIHQIWCDLLQHQDFGPDDFFNEIGGNSLLLVELANVLERKFNLINIAIEDIQADPSIRGIAKIIDKKINKTALPVNTPVTEHLSTNQMAKRKRPKLPQKRN